MKPKKTIYDPIEACALTEDDLREFLSAPSERQWEVLLAHAEKNDRVIQINKSKWSDTSVGSKNEDNPQKENRAN